MSPVKWGVLGTGWIAGEVLEQGIRRAGGIVHVLGSRNPSTASAFAQKHNITNVTTYEGVIDDPEVEAVYLALPTHLHFEWTEKAAKKGKHVLCEKPVTPTADEMLSIIHICKSNNVVFLDGTFWPHYPRTPALHEFLYPSTPNTPSKIGKIRSVIASYSWFGIDPNNIRLKPELEPMGALGDIGWYTTRFALFAYNFEMPEKVVGVITGKDQKTGGCRAISAVLIWSGNRSSTFDVTFDTAGTTRSEIVGEKGIVRMADTHHPFGGRLDDGKEPRTYFQWALDGAGNGNKEVWEQVYQDVDAGSSEYMVRDFHDCMAGKKSWEKWANESLAVHRVLDAIWESAHSNSKPVNVLPLGI